MVGQSIRPFRDANPRHRWLEGTGYLEPWLYEQSSHTSARLGKGTRSEVPLPDPQADWPGGFLAASGKLGLCWRPPRQMRSTAVALSGEATNKYRDPSD
jgi:hypothetical protein